MQVFSLQHLIVSSSGSISKNFKSVYPFSFISSSGSTSLKLKFGNALYKFCLLIISIILKLSSLDVFVSLISL